MSELAHALEVHLVYASIVWIAAWLLTSIERGSATTKYWIWVATSLNFLLPVSVIPGTFWPQRVAWFVSVMMAQATDRLELRATAVAIVSAVWLIGAFLMIVRLALRIRADRDAARGPSTEGILKPRIFLPDGIDRMLTPRELDAVVIHERTHATRRDNLIRLLHEISLCILWFVPLVWIAGRRLALYRELSCDESVAAKGLSDDLVSALAKFAEPASEPLLHATASSFVRDRLARLDESPPPQRRSSAAIVIAFGAVLLLAAIGPAAQTSAAAICAAQHARR